MIGSTRFDFAGSAMKSPEKHGLEGQADPGSPDLDRKPGKLAQLSTNSCQLDSLPVRCPWTWLVT